MLPPAKRRCAQEHRFIRSANCVAFKNVFRPIRNGIDTIVGSTGYSILSAKHVDDFCARHTRQNTGVFVILFGLATSLSFALAANVLVAFMNAPSYIGR